MKRTLSLLALCVTAAACSKPADTAATTDTGMAGMAMSTSADAAIPALKSNWSQMSGYIVQAADMVSEADYAFKPVKSVRSFGELVGHVAGSQKLICATALGDPAPAEDAVEKTAKTKAALVAALKESNDYCAKAYDMTAAAGGAAVTLFGQPNTKVGALALNAVHDGEHYGNMVTYMRMKGLVPPSSMQQMPMGDTAKKDSTGK